jgi:hypothetical protein
MNQTHILKKIDGRLMHAIAEVGVNIDPMTASTKFTGELPDVNAHAAGVIRSQISEGVGMDTEHLFFQPLPGL